MNIIVAISAIKNAIKIPLKPNKGMSSIAPPTGKIKPSIKAMNNEYFSLWMDSA